MSIPMLPVEGITRVCEQSKTTYGIMWDLNSPDSPS